MPGPIPAAIVFSADRTPSQYPESVAPNLLRMVVGGNGFQKTKGATLSEEIELKDLSYDADRIARSFDEMDATKTTTIVRNLVPDGERCKDRKRDRSFLRSPTTNNDLHWMEYSALGD